MARNTRRSATEKPTAEETFKTRAAKIRSHLAEIEAEIAKREAVAHAFAAGRNAGERAISWGSAGDLGHAEVELDNIRAFLTGEAR